MRTFVFSVSFRGLWLDRKPFPSQRRRNAAQIVLADDLWTVAGLVGDLRRGGNGRHAVADEGVSQPVVLPWHAGGRGDFQKLLRGVDVIAKRAFVFLQRLQPLFEIRQDWRDTSDFRLTFSFLDLDKTFAARR